MAERGIIYDDNTESAHDVVTQCVMAEPGSTCGCGDLSKVLVLNSVFCSAQKLCDMYSGSGLVAPMKFSRGRNSL